jgi:hypothetical protein
MILDRNFTPGDGTPEVNLCGFPYHGVVQHETFINTPINNGQPLLPYVAYQLGVSTEFPEGLTHIRALQGGVSGQGPWGDTNFNVWYDPAKGLVLYRNGSGGVAVTATLTVSLLTLSTGKRICVDWYTVDDAHYKMNSDTFVLKAPGQPAVVRSPAEAALDAASGKQWLNYLVMHGVFGQIGGNSVTMGAYHWFYCADDGSRWHVAVADTQDPYSANIDNYDFTFTRMDSAEAPRTQRVLVSDPPTYTYDYQSRGGDGLPLHCPTGGIVEATMFIEDIRPDGARVVLGYRNVCPYSVGVTAGMNLFLYDEPVSLYFNQITISGGVAGISASISSLYDPPTTFGSFTGPNPTMAFDNRIVAVWFDANGNPVPVKLSRTFPSAEQIINVPTKTSGTWTANAAGDFKWKFTWGSQTAEWVCHLTHTKETTVIATMVSASPEQWTYSCTSKTASSLDFEGIIQATVPLHDETSNCSPYSVTASLADAYKDTWQYNGAIGEQPYGAYHGSGYLRAPYADSTHGTGNSCMLAIKRLSNKYFGLIAMKFPVSITDPAQFRFATSTYDMVWIGGFSPVGKDGLPQYLGVLPDNPVWHTRTLCPSGSFDPVTQTIARRNDGSNICFF